MTYFGFIRFLRTSLSFTYLSMIFWLGLKRGLPVELQCLTVFPKPWHRTIFSPQFGICEHMAASPGRGYNQ